jgi:CheY-like chemotaxis protein
MGVAEILQMSGCVAQIHHQPANVMPEVLLFKPHIILTDFEMPGMTGPEVVKMFRAHEQLRDVPIIVSTGRTDQRSLLSAMAAGADDFITKDQIQKVMLVKICAMLRLRTLSIEAQKSKQLEAVKSLIGTYKHEFGNILTITEGGFRKLERDFHFEAHPSCEKVHNSFKRFRDVLQKLSRLREVEEEGYAEGEHILKVG